MTRNALYNMRSLAFTLTASFGLAAMVWSQLAAAQDDRDFIFTDDEGHLVLRFAGAGPGGLDADQTEEIVNVQLSTMVHDRLRADGAFEAEPVDTAWAHSLAPEIEKQVRESAPEFSGVQVECRSASCRLTLEHAGGRRVSEHQALMTVIQHALQAFIETNPGSFEPVFLIAAHFQDPDDPFINVFLRRTIREHSAGQPTGGR